jgi:hypothetical protein
LEVPKHGWCSETFAALFAALRCLSRSHLFSDHFWEACMVAPLIKLLAVLFFIHFSFTSLALCSLWCND